MSKTIIVSNRLPVKITEKDGELILKSSAGGLATGLSSVLAGDNNIWIGWPGMEIPEEKHQMVRDQLAKQKLMPVFLSNEEAKQFYEGFSNEILWPVFHYMSTYARYETDYWNYYVKVNNKFKKLIQSVLEEDDVLWVHDYQLLLLPALLREEHPDISIGFFQHIPFPSFELFRLLPWRSELIEGMLGADLLGFHTYDDARHFLDSATRLIELQCSSNVILYNNRTVVVESFPMGIDAQKFEDLIQEDEVKKNIVQLKKTFNDVTIVLSIDRLDYSKGILQRLQAFDMLLQSHKEYSEQVSLYMIVVPSRDTVLQYRELKDEIDKLVGNINAKFRTNNWTPIHYFYRSFPIEELSALYQFADVCLVTPMRDGMNLVCKEYIASRTKSDGVLILSEMAGASKELTDALIVNPNNVQQMSQAIVTALNMPKKEQERRMRQMRELVKRYNINNWVNIFMQRLKEVKEVQLSMQTKYIGSNTFETIKNRYLKATKRLFLLDYDGTLVGFNDDINKAVPDRELYSILEALIEDKMNKVVIISGRNHHMLEEWFGRLNIEMIGEHGVWHKKNGKWDDIKGLSFKWKEEVMPILNTYTERTPGSFIEEKTYSLVWHYRKAEKELGELRSKELLNNLRYFIADKGLHLMPGNKIVELKNMEINKGKAALRFTQEENYDFMLAMGDDVTDEDLFKALKEKAITIKVNGQQSAAHYYLRDHTEVRRFLKALPAKPVYSPSGIFEKFRRLIPNPFAAKK